jgi:hypothetical protein
MTDRIHPYEQEYLLVVKEALLGGDNLKVVFTATSDKRAQSLATQILEIWAHKEARLFKLKELEV